MQKDIFDKIINFLLGASWAFVIVGALLTFKVFFTLGVGLSLFLTILFIFLSLFVVILIDSFVVNRQKLYEIQKQTKLLEDLVQNQTDKS